jgi:hypothetical protein
MKFGALTFAVLGVVTAIGTVTPARADDDWRWRERHERAWREHEWREHAWREHEWRERYYPPVVVAPPPYRYYAPPPAYYANPYR